jgi:hypothetical protein
MDVLSTSPLPATGLRWHMSSGAPALTVVCKATFVLQQGEASLAPQQEPIASDEAYWEAEPDRFSPVMTDLVPYKARADVVLVGHAFAPQQQPVRSLVARLVVGSMDKSIEVCTSRVFMPNGDLKEGPPWLKQPLGWDSAAGGPETSNPAGMRFDVPDAMGRFALPSLQPPGAQVARLGDTFAPVGFGPIPPAWPSRAVKLYQHARTFLKRDWASRPIPEPIDHAFFNIAPPDQQIDAIRADERIMLGNLHPDSPRMISILPGIVPVATVQRQGRAPSPLALTCDTLWIDTDRQICTLVWRGTMALAHAHEAGQIVVSVEGLTGAAGLGIQPPPPSQRQPAASSSRESQPFARAETVAQPAPRGSGTEAALPFQTGAFALRSLGVSTVSAAPVAPPAPPAPSVPPSQPLHRAMTMDIPEGLAAQSNIGPFRQAPGAPSSSPGVAPPPPAPIAPPPIAPPPPALIAPLSIGERMATEQAMAESKALLEKRGSDEPDLVGPLARPSSLPAESASPAPARDAGPKRALPVSRDGRDAVLLLWLDSAQVPRMRKKPAFREILDALEEQEPDPELDASVGGAPADVDDHRAVFEILTQGLPSDAEGLQRAMIEAVRDDGKFVAPLLLLAGELAFPFDELETLRATVVAASPLVGADEPLRAAVESAREFLKAPDLTCAPAVAEGMTTRIRDAFGQGKRMVQPGYLDAQTERVLLDQRHYQKRTVIGGPHIRALLHMAGSQAPVPTYLPAMVAARLPLFQRFRARLVATCHISEDQNENHPACLKVLAFARIAPAPGLAAQPAPPKKPA